MNTDVTIQYKWWMYVMWLYTVHLYVAVSYTEKREFVLFNKKEKTMYVLIFYLIGLGNTLNIHDVFVLLWSF